MLSMASISSSSSAAVRVDKATSEFLIGPDWTMNIDICDTINSNHMQAKDVVKAVKKRLQHKNPKVQLLALTLLESMVKNCSDYVHFQIPERNILQVMIKIVKKKTDMHVRDKILTLVSSWHDAFGGSGGRYPQYYMAYEDLRRLGVEFPRCSPDVVPIFTPPVRCSMSRQSQPGHEMPRNSSTRLDAVMAAEENLSLLSITSMREILNLLTDMLQAIDQSDCSAVKEEVIIDLVEQCRANQRKLMQMLTTMGDEELLGQGLELNDNLQDTLARHDAIASGSPLPPPVINAESEAAGEGDFGSQPAEVGPPSSNIPMHRQLMNDEEEEDDDFAKLAQRHTKSHSDASNCTLKVNDEALALAKTTYDVESSDTPLKSVMSNALVPITMPSSTQTKDQDFTDLLNIALSTPTSTDQTSQITTPLVPSASLGSSEAHPGTTGDALNNYVTPWARPLPQPQPQPQPEPPWGSLTQRHFQSPQDVHTQLAQQPQLPPLYRNVNPPRMQPWHQLSSGYPPPPWAPTPGYFSNPNPMSRPSNMYLTSGQTFSPAAGSSLDEPISGHSSLNGSNSSPGFAAQNNKQKSFILSYRLFEDLNVFGNTEGAFKASSHSSPSVSGSNQHITFGGRK